MTKIAEGKHFNVHAVGNHFGIIITTRHHIDNIEDFQTMIRVVVAMAIIVPRI